MASRHTHASKKDEVMRFDKFLNDIVTLIKKDGTTYDDIRADVQADMILITDPLLDIESGDKIKRPLPSGVEETFEVTDPVFRQKFTAIPAHYEIKYRRV